HRIAPVRPDIPKSSASAAGALVGAGPRDPLCAGLKIFQTLGVLRRGSRCHASLHSINPDRTPEARVTEAEPRGRPQDRISRVLPPGDLDVVLLPGRNCKPARAVSGAGVLTLAGVPTVMGRGTAASGL